MILCQMSSTFVGVTMEQKECVGSQVCGTTTKSELGVVL